MSAYVETGFRPDVEDMRAIAVIVVVLYHAHFLGPDGGFIGVDVFFGADATMTRLAEVAPDVVVIGDNPNAGVDPPACLSDHPDDATRCATSRAEAVRADRISGEYVAAEAHGATFIDTTDWFSTPSTCPAVIGDLLVLRDETHMTPPMAEFLTPLPQAALAPAFARL